MKTTMEIGKKYKSALDELRSRSIISSTILNNSPEKEFLWKEVISGVVFRARPFDILAAELELNRILCIRAYVSVEDFLHLLGCTDDYPEMDKWGWSIDMEAEEGWSFIDFTHEMDESGCYIIDYPFGPSTEYLKGWD